MSKIRKYHYFLSLADSSDEENSVNHYMVSDSWKNFNNGLSSKENNLLSFITHAAGIYVLYSPAIQKKYYEHKNTHLMMDPDKFKWKLYN